VTAPAAPGEAGPGAAPAGRRLGLVASIALGLLAAPRVVLHDLGVDVGPLNLLLVFGPPAVWIAYVLRRRVARPLLALTGVGVVDGVVLATIHMLLWHEAYDGDPPRLGGNLDGELSPGVEELVLRGASAASSVVVGVVIGAIAGLVAEVMARRVRSAG
jgi:hypothetical protein